ncbi:MAG: tRNA-uridine aminocarboxypropyltransferase [Kangiellaceae bacterium]
MTRKTCNQCMRPTALCYCSKIQPINNRLELIIIQHPKESKHPFNTGNLVHQCLKNSTLMIKERLSIDELNQLLEVPCAILYPSMTWLPEVPELTIEKSADNQFHINGDTELSHAVKRLIVIDATWRKSKKMMFQHSQLQLVPRVSLIGNLKSNYRIRNSKLSGALNSVESVHLAFKTLEPENHFENMIEVFEHMVTSQLSYQINTRNNNEDRS